MSTAQMMNPNNRIRILSFLLTGLLAGCVSQTTIESKVPDQAGVSDNAFKAKLHTERAGEYYKVGNYAIALDAAEQALKAVSNYAPAYNMLGLIRMQLGQDDAATLAFDQAMRIAPEDSDVLNNYGWFICQRRGPGPAMQYFQRALQNPLYNSPERALHNAGVCARKANDVGEAEKHFRAALVRQPQYYPAVLDLADLLEKQSRLREAEQLFGRFMQQTATPPIDALLLGVRLTRASGDKNSEGSYIQQLRRRFPDDTRVRALDNR